MSQIIFCRADCQHNINGVCTKPSITITNAGTCNKQHPHIKPETQQITKTELRIIQQQGKDYQTKTVSDYSPLSIAEVKP